MGWQHGIHVCRVTRRSNSSTSRRRDVVSGVWGRSPEGKTGAYGVSKNLFSVYAYMCLSSLKVKKYIWISAWGSNRYNAAHIRVSDLHVIIFYPTNAFVCPKTRETLYYEGICFRNSLFSSSCIGSENMHISITVRRKARTPSPFLSIIIRWL